MFLLVDPIKKWAKEVNRHFFKESICLNFLNVETESEQVFGEHDPHKIHEQNITNSLFNEDTITD